MRRKMSTEHGKRADREQIVSRKLSHRRTTFVTRAAREQKQSRHEQ